MRSLHLLLVTSALCLTSASALAESAADRTTARKLAQEGQQALLEHDYDTAADRFRRAQEMVQAPTLILGLAQALVGQGKLVEGYEAYRRILGEGVSRTSPDAFKRAFEKAKLEIEQVQPRLAWITIGVQGVNDSVVPQVTLNGQEVPAASLSVARPVDPGTITLRAEAPGYEPAQVTLTATEGDSGVSATLALIPLPQSDVAPTDASAASPPGAPTIVVQDAGTPLQYPFGYIALGLGGAGLITGVGAFFFGEALRKNVQADCDQDVADNSALEGMDCRIRRSSDFKNVDRFRAVSAGGYIAGGVLVGTGIVLLLTAPSSQPEQASVRPYFGWGEAGVVGRF